MKKERFTNLPRGNEREGGKKEAERSEKKELNHGERKFEAKKRLFYPHAVKGRRKLQPQNNSLLCRALNIQKKKR